MTQPSLFDASPEAIRAEIAADIERVTRYAMEDICARKSRGSATSEAASDRIGPSKERLREMVLDVLRMRGDFGGTTHEVARHLGMEVHSISGRMSELKRDGLAIETDRRRSTRSASAAVVVAREFA